MSSSSNNSFLLGLGAGIGSALLVYAAMLGLKSATSQAGRDVHYPQQGRKITNDKMKLLEKTLKDIRSRLQKIQRGATTESLVEVQKQLNLIDDLREDGKFASNARGMVPEGQAELHYLLNQCYELKDSIMRRQAKVKGVSGPLQPIVRQLLLIKDEIEELQGRNPTLKSVQEVSDKLQKVESKKKDGKFMVGDKIPHGQAALFSLMEEIYELKEMLTLEATLVDIKGRLKNLVGKAAKDISAEIRAIETELASVENLRVDGKFLSTSGNVPHGQAILHALLAECIDLKEQITKKEVEVNPVAKRLLKVYVRLTQQKGNANLEEVQKIMEDLDEINKTSLFDNTTLTNMLEDAYELKELVWIEASLRDIVRRLKYSSKSLEAREDLRSIENLQIDGKFMTTDGKVLPGQALLKDLVAECYALID